MEDFAYPILEDRMRKLYDASLNGCVSTLNTLNQRDPLILSRVLYPFTETSLHIASLLGHLEFCHALLEINPDLAIEVNSEGRCPLHFASDKGNTEIVKFLSQKNPETCLIRDKDDKLPLHYAAMRGRIGTIKELISVRPDSIWEMIENDGSILHLCVRYNHLEVLKLLVESVGEHNQFLSAKDKEDNTVLHLAVKRRQIKIIEYLLSLSEMSRAKNSLNREGLTSLDMLMRCPRDAINLEIEHMLTEAGVQRFTQQTLPNSAPSNEPQQPLTSPNIENEPNRCNKCLDKLENFCTRYLISKSNWIHKKTREYLMVAATVIATVTFQSVISPPGGVWQADTTTDGFACSSYGFCEAGTAVLGYAQSPDFLKFIFFNSASFFSSLCVLLILISGFPLDNKAIMWILAVLMIAAVTCMLLTYMWALGLASPEHIYYKIRGLGFILVGTWSFLLVAVALIQIFRIVFWARSRPRRSSRNAPVLSQN